MSSLIPKELECSLCKDVFRNPKTIECLHSFCAECLEILIERNHSTTKLGCPICRTPIHIQPDQVSTLPTDLFLIGSLRAYNSIRTSMSKLDSQKILCSDGENEATTYCVDCEAYLCDHCTTSHRNFKMSKNHHVSPIQESENGSQTLSITKSTSPNFCHVHQDEEVKLYCDECKIPICSLCVEQHPSHKVIILSNIIANEKQAINELINQKIKKKVKPKEKELKEAIKKCKEIIKQLEINSTVTQTQINQFFKKIRAQVDEKEQELLNKLESIGKAKKKELELQREELKFAVESISGSCKMIENSLSLPNNDVQLLTMKKQYCARLDYLANCKWKTDPKHHPCIEFSSFDKEENLLYLNLSRIGIITSNDISASKTLISRNERQKVHENEDYQFEIQCYSKEGLRMDKGGNVKHFTVKIEGESTNYESDVQDLSNGNYQVRLKINDKGRYRISVEYDGVNISSSPFQLEVLPNQRNYHGILHPISKFGSKGNGNGQFSNPYGITISPKGNVYVCDFSHHRIQIFNSEGIFLSTFGSNGSGNGQFNYPCGVTMNSKGNILVCDGQNNRVQIFSADGIFISKFGSNGNGNGQFNNPNGICVDSKDNIYVCDYSNHRIQVFNPDGVFLTKFGSNGNGNGQFVYPRGIAISTKGNIYVCDLTNHRIQVFNALGQFITKFGSKGSGPGEFNNPWGICADQNDNILVCDQINNRVQIFDYQGTFIDSFTVNNPAGIVIDSTSQNMYVCGFDNKISIY